MNLSAGDSQGPYGDSWLTLPIYRDGEDPELVMSMLDSQYELLDKVRTLRRQYEAENGPLEERLYAANIEAWCVDYIEASRSWLRATARRGGRGVVRNVGGGT